MKLPLEDKQAREKIIQNSFDKIALKYDLLNDCLSFGLQRWWKRKLVQKISPKAQENILDLAGGTGSIAAMLLSSGAKLTILDPSTAMLSVAKERYQDQIIYQEGFGEKMPFASESFDQICVAFGVRNSKDLNQMLRECYRVLKPNGRFLCLEFSKPIFFFRPFYQFYLKFFVPFLGGILTGNKIAYQYLAESVELFDSQEQLAGKIKHAGFQNITYQNLTLGVTAIHQASKKA